MSLATPVAWQLIGLLLLLALVAALVLLSTATYARVVTVPGSIVLDKGVAKIVPMRGGVVTRLSVSEGQHVEPGQTLALIRAEESLAGGETASGRVRRSLEAQDAGLASQTRALTAAAAADQERLRAQTRGLAAEMDGLAAQIAEQERLVALASNDYQRTQAVAARGFISARDLDSRQSALLSRRLELAQFKQLRATKLAALDEAHRSMAQADATANAQIAGAQAQREQLAQQSAQNDLAQGFAVTAPIRGTVTALTARPGQATGEQQQLMMIVPADAVPRVEMYVPSSAVGFVAPGQRVRVAIDSFPYQQFGTVDATVADVAAATVDRPGAGGAIVPAYLVTAALRRPWILAFGRRQPLVTGMTLSARIVTEDRTLLAWLFEPILGVRNR